MTLLPFTLEAWRSGLQPCTVTYVPVNKLTEFSAGVVGEFSNNEIEIWDFKGEPQSGKAGHVLRLRPKTEKLWVTVCRSERGGLLSAVFDIAPPPPLHREIARVEIEVPCP